jgi:CheY-like chemotaxis protein
MGGRIDVEAVAPRGASFRVLLPSHTRASYPAPAPKPPMLMPGGRASVLVVDDEPLMCELLAAMLSDSYEVAAFTSPRAALASMLEGDFDVILCDVMMPELSGVDLYGRATSERPELADRFVFITGGAFTQRARLFLNHIGGLVLRKPCARAELLSAVNANLASNAARAQR